MRLLAIALMATAALFGIPIIIDPPPGDTVEESRDAQGRIRKRGGRPVR